MTDSVDETPTANGRAPRISQDLLAVLSILAASGLTYVIAASL